MFFWTKKKMRFMQTESVLQTKNRSGPAKNRFSVALMFFVCVFFFFLWGWELGGDGGVHFFRLFG